MPRIAKRGAPERRSKLSETARGRATRPLPEWLGEAVSGVPRVLLCGCDRALVENCGEIRELTTDSVRLATALGDVRVEGRDLRLEALGGGSTLIRGEIWHVALPGGQEDA